MRLVLLILIISFQTQAKFRIAMGSCNKQWLPQNHFSEAAKLNPDLWLWLGDTIYADYYNLGDRQAAYNLVKNNPHYQKLISKTSVLGIWDDHDSSYNNSEKKPLNKEAKISF